jgi:hypothetical protein
MKKEQWLGQHARKEAAYREAMYRSRTDQLLVENASAPFPLVP